MTKLIKVDGVHISRKKFIEVAKAEGLVQADELKQQIEDLSRTAGLLFGAKAKLEQEIAELKAHIERLREHVKLCMESHGNSLIVPPKWAEDLLNETPAQSLAAHDAEVIGRCAERLDTIATDLKMAYGQTSVTDMLEREAYALRQLKEVKE